jgi:hypothetical protein
MKELIDLEQLDQCPYTCILINNFLWLYEVKIVEICTFWPLSVIYHKRYRKSVTFETHLEPILK